MSEADRIAACAVRFWKRAGLTEWPTVRRVSKTLRIPQGAVESHAPDGPYITTAWNTERPEPFGEHYVEAMTPDVDAEWQKYWSAK